MNIYEITYRTGQTTLRCEPSDALVPTGLIDDIEVRVKKHEVLFIIRRNGPLHPDLFITIAENGKFYIDLQEVNVDALKNYLHLMRTPQ